MCDQQQERYEIWNDDYTNTGIMSRSFEVQLAASEAKEFTRQMPDICIKITVYSGN